MLLLTFGNRDIRIQHSADDTRKQLIGSDSEIRSSLRRIFDLVQWSRKGSMHLFLTAHDEGCGDRTWITTDIGPMMRLKNPTISIMPGGEVIVIHRNGSDSFVRSEFWSMPDALDFRSREMIADPETAAQNRVKEIYAERGGVKPADRPWWKFW